MGEAELETLIDGFIWAIECSGFPFSTWMDQLGQWMLRHNEIPRPSDIVNLIEPPPPVYSAMMYIQIKKNLLAGNVFVDDDERAYCRAYEEQELKKVRGGSEEYLRARSEIEHFQRLQIAAG